MSAEKVDGIQIIRRGSQWTVHIRAVLHYRGRLRGRFDAVIDETNTIPFFTPIWADIPTFLMIWQLAREVWWYEGPFPLSAIGYLLEPFYLRVYRKTSVLTYSASTKSDLENLGFRGVITVLPVGIEQINYFDDPKAAEPTFIYVGRIAASKRVHEIIQAFALFRRRTGSGQLALIGEGNESYVRRLETLAARLGASSAIEYCGWLKGAAKHHRMSAAHALLLASVREGWGLVVTECNRCGTPAVAYNVPGLRDSVRHLETGLLVDPTPERLAEGMLRVTSDQELYMQLRDAALRWGQTFDYEASASLVSAAVASVVHTPSGANATVKKQ